MRLGARLRPFGSVIHFIYVSVRQISKFVNTARENSVRDRNNISTVSHDTADELASTRRNSQ